jgi:hypothetical protein
MKKILFVIATLIFTISNPITSHARQSSPPASSLYNINEKIELENGNTVDYELTIFPSDTRSNIKTATKTATCKRNNKTVATIKLSATFTYTGSSATCTSASSTYSMEGGWSYSNRTTTRTKNTASTSAKISKNNEYFNAGVTITCSNSGVIS